MFCSVDLAHQQRISKASWSQPLRQLYRSGDGRLDGCVSLSSMGVILEARQLMRMFGFRWTSLRRKAVGELGFWGGFGENNIVPQGQISR